jgi:glyoxylase-like metal-dependent hydrolase (beta-lactamase superfamily II)
MASVTAIRMHYNSVYLVEDGGERVLIDTGPDYRGAWEELRTALGGKLPDAVLATHGHHDHASLGAAWQETGVPAYLGPRDRHFTAAGTAASERELDMLSALVEEAGPPEELLTEARAGLTRRRHAVKTARSDYPPPGSQPRWPTGLRFLPYEPMGDALDGVTLPAGLRVIGCPGHTPGNVVAWHAGEGWLFSGDQLLPDITPTPGLQEEGETRFRSLPRFQESLENLGALEPARCFPGHGEPFEAVGDSIRTNLDVIESRTAKVRATLRESGPLPVYGVCEALYPRAVRRRFWQILPTVTGHLDVLEERGEAVVEAGRWRAT